MPGLPIRPSLALAAALALAGCTPTDSNDTAVVTGTDTATVPTTGTGTATGSAVSDCDRNHPNRTVGLLYCDPRASEGYTLFAPNRSETTYLIDLEGKLVHSWNSNYEPGESVYLLDNGNLLRTAKDTGGTPFFAGGAGGRIEEIDWDGNVVWSFSYKSSTHLQHHDIEQLPNGNILMIAWELKTEAEAIAAGRDPGRVNGSLWVNHLVEVDPATDAIVWEWHLWDHLVQDFDASKDNFGVIADNPGKVDLNATSPGPPGEPDWNHVNGLDYNADLDQIVLSAHHQDEIWIIDHGLTTAEAAGPAGDLLYRWGNPQVWDAGTGADKQLSGQHDPTWIPAGTPGEGNLLLFNNGVDWSWSSAFELTPPLNADGTYALSPGQTYEPAGPAWTYEDPGTFYSSFISGVQRLPNGNTLICEGDDGRFFEVTDEGDIVWEYINPVGGQGPVSQGSNPNDNLTFRADRYSANHPGLQGRDLSPKGTIED